MNDKVLIELARKWESVETSQGMANVQEETGLDLRNKGYRDGRKECAHDLQALIDILGDK